MGQLKLSLCMIVKNEERFLPRFFEAHSGFFDDWVILDTGSTDATLDMIRAQGIEVRQAPWEHDFAKARNQALAQCSGDWVLALDADETVTRQDQKILRRFLGEGEVNGFELKIKNYVSEESLEEQSALGFVEYVPPDGSYMTAFGGGKDFGYRPTRLIRCFQNRVGYEWKSPVHEVLDLYSDPKKRALGRIEEVCIHHVGLMGQKEKAESKKALYGGIASNLKRLAKEDGHPKLLFEAARFVDDVKEKEALLVQARAKAPKDPSLLKELIHLMLSEKRPSDAREMAQELIGLEPDRLEGHLFLSEAYAIEEKWEQARQALRKQFRRFQTHPLYNYQLALFSFQAGKTSEAASYSNKAFQLAPGSPMIQKLNDRLTKLSLASRKASFPCDIS